MKIKMFSVFAAVTVVLCSVAVAAPSRTYQVTGPVLEVNESMIAVQKGDERWEIMRNASTKTGDAVKVGDRVTIEYTMSATKIEVKADKAAKAEARSSAAPAASSQKK
ncbi:MAG: hypothetical protein M3372_03440 [Verrucomicrobiota bacterium]|nr:hypothetical protein [Verrucomicrobiota bacterium]